MATKFQIVLKEERVIYFSFNGKWFGIKGFFCYEGGGAHTRGFFPLKALPWHWKMVLTICILFSFKTNFIGHFPEVWKLTQKPSPTKIFSIVLVKNRRITSLKAHLEEEHLILHYTFQCPPKNMSERQRVLYKAGSISSTNYVTKNTKNYL